MPDPSQRFEITRRTALIAAGATPLLAMMASKARAATKVSPSAVYYQTSPKTARMIAPFSCRPTLASWSTEASLQKGGAGCG